MDPNKRSSGGVSSVLALLFLTSSVLTSQAQVIWAVGQDDNGWPSLGGGGENASFVQENGAISPLPGSPESTVAPQGADNDYYFAGVYTEVIPGNGEYEPVGVVSVDEEAAERAFAGGDLDLRYHFNLPDTFKPTDLLTVTFDANNLDTSGADPRFGVEVYVNGVKVQSEVLIRGPQLDKDFTTPQFTVASVNAKVGPGADNIVSLRGTSYNGEGGGNWMGVDYIRLEKATEAIPAPVFPWAVGKDDNGWPVGDGGGPNATFVQENGTISALPGSPTSPEVAQQGDNDYYFAGSYTTVIAGNGAYEPVGIVKANEESAERAFAGADNELRYHFNLPNTLRPDDLLAVSYDAFNLDTSGADPRYGVEVYFNGVRVQPQVLIRAAQLGRTNTTPQFTLASVNAQTGPGFDNIVTLKGINFSTDGGGNWMGVDFVQLNPVSKPIPPAVLPWAVGKNDNGWPVGNGGGPNASFVQENGVISALPGSPTSPEVDQQADNDYYLAGVYSTVIAGNGNYQPVGEVPVNEEASERAFAGGDLDLRYHFNLPANLSPTDLLSVSFDTLNLDTSGADPRFGIEVYFNNVKVMDQVVIRPDDLGTNFNTQPFTLAKVNAQVGPGFDNIVSLRGISYNSDGGGNWMGIDFVQLNPVLPAPFPWAVGMDDNGWPIGNGGGPNASFVQEAGVNTLPGRPNNPEIDQQGDDDYYFAGEYTTAIDSVITLYGDYAPVGTVLVNEEAAERAFAGSDNEKRYHFNLPASLQQTDQLLVTFDANNLDTSGTDPQYGVEIYFNGVLVQPELLIKTENLNVDYTTEPFTLASVNAKTGPGFDNIVTLKGINKSADGGGQWMGIDYVQLNPMPKAVFPWAVGMRDNGWPVGNGGGTNATFVQENGSINDLPGNPGSPEVNQQADNDYYFAGIYTNTIPANGDYVPVGIVPRNEEAAERAFAAADNDLRYHFNLPSTLSLTNQVTVSFDAINLDTSGADPRYGIEIYFNSVLVQPEILVRTNQLNVTYTTAPFTLASANAKLGLGTDNIVSLKGVNYNADGGGNWMGIDYVQLNPLADNKPLAFLPSVLSAGKITLNWTGTGNLEWAPAVTGPWTAVTPAPSNNTFSENIVVAQNRFYRLRKP
jgi:hypothetical protein